jgi:hypothetical protein
MDYDEHKQEIEVYRKFLYSDEVGSMWQKSTPVEFAEFLNGEIKEQTVAIREYAELINRVLYQSFLDAPSEADREQAIRYCISTIIASARKIEMASNFARHYAETSVDGSDNDE